ncbi:hypothetical protein ACFQ4K_10050 [Tistrella bauzanensis]
MTPAAGTRDTMMQGPEMAVYTAVADDEMRALLAGYDIGPFQGLAGIQQGWRIPTGFWPPVAGAIS